MNKNKNKSVEIKHISFGTSLVCFQKSTSQPLKKPKKFYFNNNRLVVKSNNMKSSIIALMFIGFAVAIENGNRSLDSGLQAGKIQDEK